ncbi:hypothetical protein [Micromonospora sp. CB01531]|uniref:hypothetical protein n=1 Tax=Micromonospora sp. CB01531 TaxID=1718947 RepID=UPI000938973F|nr:hypothetical protein [Micromonospora sp. CB01531]OKI45088.1 hypothetical protein A6A27_11760 [Micromonospora sp. CB01531]
MRITPRKEEVAAVVAVLESDQYDSAQAMAKAVIKEVAELLDMRDWVALTHRFGDNGQLGLNWGPFGSAIEAQRLADKLALGGRFSVVRLGSPGLLVANLLGAKRPTKDFCANPACLHAAWTHSALGNSRGKCVLESCPCDEMKK